MDVLCPRDVVIVGGSICGLMHGIVLLRLGHNVTILEQSKESLRPAQAAGILVGPYFQEFMNKHDRSKQDYSMPNAIQFINQQAKVTRRLSFPLKMTSWDTLYYRLRANFDGFITEYCPVSYVNKEEQGRGVFDLGKRVTSVQDNRDSTGKLRVMFDDLTAGTEGMVLADFVVAADGANSAIRRQLIPEPQPGYSGYVAWRGTVPEEDVAEETVSLLDHQFSAYVMRGSYMVSYIIPGSKGTLARGKRLVNYLWYHNIPESDQFATVMTDTELHRHRNTLPVGKMQPKVWERQKAAGRAVPLPKPYLELMAKTEQPFITAIRDTAPCGAVFMDNRLILVGDAHALFRPHIGASTNQAALHALQLERVFRGEKSLEEWETEVTAYGKRARALSVAVGDFFQKGWLASLPWVFTFLRLLLWESISKKFAALLRLFSRQGSPKKLD